MNNWIRVGVIILVIGLSLFTGSVYRSSNTKSFGIVQTFSGLDSNEWSPRWRENNIMRETYFLWAPREFRLEVRVTTIINVYILDSEGIRLWEENGTVEPVWAFEETGQDVYTLQINKRDKYFVLVYNPTNESVKYELNMTIHGIERDLLYASVAVICAGLVFTAVSVILSWKLPKQKELTPQK
jgi:hypothetical protein